MFMNEAIEIKKEADALFTLIKSLEIRIRIREGNLWRFDGVLLTRKEKELQNLRKKK